MTKDWMLQSYQFGVLGCHAVHMLNESLELVVLCEGDDLQYSPELGENLEGREHNSEDGLVNTADQRQSWPARKTVPILKQKHDFTW